MEWEIETGHRSNIYIFCYNEAIIVKVSSPKSLHLLLHLASSVSPCFVMD